jgi:histidinol dehydrogenase
MTQDEIIEMARQAGFTISDHGRSAEQVKRMMTHFGKLVAAKEREACAKELEAYSVKHRELTAKNPRDVDYAIMYTLDVHAHLLRDDFFEKHKEKYGSRGEA